MLVSITAMMNHVCAEFVFLVLWWLTIFLILWFVLKLLLEWYSSTRSIPRVPVPKKTIRRCVVGEVLFEELLQLYENGRGSNGPSYVLHCHLGDTKEPVKLQVDTGCTESIISLALVRSLGLMYKVDTSKTEFYEAIGGVIQQTVGVLRVPITTPSGFTILRQIDVVDMRSAYGLIGLDVLSVYNCTLLLDEYQPKLLLRAKMSTCCGTPEFYNAADIFAKLNGKRMMVLLDTGAFRTIVPQDMEVSDKSLSEEMNLLIAANIGVPVSRKVDPLYVSIGGVSKKVTALKLNERIPIIGTDYFKNMRIDFICGKSYVTDLRS